MHKMTEINLLSLNKIKTNIKNILFLRSVGVLCFYLVSVVLGVNLKSSMQLHNAFIQWLTLSSVTITLAAALVLFNRLKPVHHNLCNR